MSDRKPCLSVGSVLLTVIQVLSLAVTAYSTDDVNHVKRTNNEVFSDFVLPENGQQIALNSQAIESIGFVGSKFGKLTYSDVVSAGSELRLGGHSAVAISAPKYDADSGQEIPSPQITFMLQLLPTLPPMIGRVPKGQLSGIYNGFQMTPDNGWFPNEVGLGVFGATFLTGNRQNRAGHRELVRMEGNKKNSRNSFSLPVDVSEFPQITSTSDGRAFEFLSCTIYEDFTPERWLIYCHLHEDCVVIWQCRVNWEDSPMKETLLSVPTMKRYRIGDEVQVSNLRFRVAEIVHWKDQKPATAWVNISDLDVVR